MNNIIVPLNRDALFSDGTKQYRFPVEPQKNEKVKLRLRTAKDNVSSVNVVSMDKIYPMTLNSSDSLFDYYEVSLLLEESNMWYYFEIHGMNEVCYFNQRGVTNNVQLSYNFIIMPGFITPEWAKGAVIYQIFVDRFCNGDTFNDVKTNEYSYIGDMVKEVNDWYKYPDAMGVREFYGGDLQGVINKLDYLSDLGIEVIYLNPIFVSPSNHKYDIQDYDYIDPHFGVIVNDGGELLKNDDHNNAHATKYIKRVTDKGNLEASNDLFAKLVEKAHERGIRVILDGVFNHCGSFNKWLDKERIYENEVGYEKGAYILKDSPYNKYFLFHNDKWPYNNSYDGWWGHDTLPKLNYENSEKLYDYILEVAKKWVSPPYNADGWRLDVAADLGHSSSFNHKFWKDFRKSVKEANNEAIILAEHYGDTKDWLNGDEWDTVMNYDAFMEPITWFLTGLEKHSDEFKGEMIGNSEAFWAAMQHNMSRMNVQSLETSMNELSNHDHSRFLTRTNRKVGRTNTLGPEAAEENVDKAIFRTAVVMQMTWPGAPTVYYGDEAGLCGFTDPDNRRTYPWGREDKELINFHKEMIRIHKDYEAFKTGSLIWLQGEYKVLCYGRFDDRDKLVIAVNSSQQAKDIVIDVWKMGFCNGDRLVSLIETFKEGYNLRAKVYNVSNGKLAITLSPTSSIVLKSTGII